ncbi:radical SAM protein [Thermodesulfobacteriota bacterium]
MKHNRHETCTIPVPPNGRLRIALAFPNTYYVGMSNLGLQVLYRLLNLIPDVSCERVFLPEPREVLQLQKTGRPLVTYESGTPVGACHILAFSLSFENDYANILTMLDLAGITPLQQERPPREPLLIAGGITTFLNPEPLAAIFDLFIIGEAEGVLQECVDRALQHYGGRARTRPPLDAFADIPGVYVPSAYTVTYDSDGRIASVTARAGFPRRIARRLAPDINAAPGSSCLITPHTEFADMALAEVSRGCPRRCRFCAAGSVYRPYRVRASAGLLSEIAPLLERGTKIGLLGAAVSDHPELIGIMQAIMAAGCRVSIASLRADRLTEQIVSLLQQCGHKTFTIAPEAGSERLRTALGKNLSTNAILRAVRVLAQCRVSTIRLYFMIGLPTETRADIDAIASLTREIKHVYYQEARGEKWLNHLSLSISAFVPKPFTPFQWHSFEQVKTLKQKLKSIAGALKKERKVALHYDLPKWGYIQALLSRGDRRTTRILLAAHAAGGDWNRAFRQTDVNPDFSVYRRRPFEEILPWDIIDHGIDKQQLWEEYQEALGEGAQGHLQGTEAQSENS